MQMTAWDFFVLFMGLAGGLALFLYGMELLVSSVQVIAGKRMRTILEKFTDNRWKSLCAGTVITAILQSSSVTTVLVVGFVAAGLMSFPQSIGVIIGSNIGSTVTAQLVAFQITQYALLMIAAGFMMDFVFTSERVRSTGRVLLGLGLLFLGMMIMSDATKPLRSYQPFLEIMLTLRHPAWGILAGCLFTAVIQSSAATTGIIISFAAQGMIPLEAGIAIALGANIGTCATAILACIGKPREAVQASLAHLFFNCFGVLLFCGWIPVFADLVRMISPSAPHLQGAERLAYEAPRQIANAHTMFNVFNSLLFITIIHQFARIINWVCPLKDGGGMKPLYLPEEILKVPEQALALCKKELLELGGLLNKASLVHFKETLHGDSRGLNKMVQEDDETDQRHQAILEYLHRLSSRDLTLQQKQMMGKMMALSELIEFYGDIMEQHWSQ